LICDIVNGNEYIGEHIEKAGSDAVETKKLESADGENETEHRNITENVCVCVNDAKVMEFLKKKVNKLVPYFARHVELIPTINTSSLKVGNKNKNKSKTNKTDVKKSKKIMTKSSSSFNSMEEEVDGENEVDNCEDDEDIFDDDDNNNNDDDDDNNNKDISANANISTTVPSFLNELADMNSVPTLLQGSSSTVLHNASCECCVQIISQYLNPKWGFELFKEFHGGTTAAASTTSTSSNTSSIDMISFGFSTDLPMHPLYSSQQSMSSNASSSSAPTPKGKSKGKSKATQRLVEAARGTKAISSFFKKKGS
jgi:hypothetical protein